MGRSGSGSRGGGSRSGGSRSSSSSRSRSFGSYSRSRSSSSGSYSRSVGRSSYSRTHSSSGYGRSSGFGGGFGHGLGHGVGFGIGSELGRKLVNNNSKDRAEVNRSNFGGYSSYNYGRTDNTGYKHNNEVRQQEPEIVYGGFGEMDMGYDSTRQRKYVGEHIKGRAKGLIGVAVIVFIISLFVAAGSDPDSNRRAYVKPNVSYSDSGYLYTDSFFSNKREVEDQLEELEDKLGYPVFLYAVDESNITESEAKYFLDKFYDKTFRDEAHLVIAYFNDIDYWEWVYGYNLNPYVNNDMVNDIIDCIYVYWDTDYSNEECFTHGFDRYANTYLVTKEELEKSASSHERWANVFRTIAGAFAVCGVLVYIAGIWINIHEEKKEREERKQRQMEEFLSKPLETFGNSEIEGLKDKYD